MNPIFAISNPNGLNGYWYDEFVQNFDDICRDHIRKNRAKKFAFIIYDFHSSVKETLQNLGVFIELDRLSGNDITIFYLDGQVNDQSTRQNRLLRNLNRIVISLNSDKIHRIPFILFFDFANGDIGNFKCYPIRDDEKFILHDLTNAIATEIKIVQENNTSSKSGSFMSALLKETPKIVYTEFVKLVLNGIFEIKK